jgi:hypothetical protein
MNGVKSETAFNSKNSKIREMAEKLVPYVGTLTCEPTIEEINYTDLSTEDKNKLLNAEKNGIFDKWHSHSHIDEDTFYYMIYILMFYPKIFDIPVITQTVYISAPTIDRYTVGDFFINRLKRNENQVRTYYDIYADYYKSRKDIKPLVCKIAFTKLARTAISNNVSNGNNGNNGNNVKGGKLKEYIKLQSGSKRLVRYGSRGGRFYMKSGSKVYIR